MIYVYKNVFGKNPNQTNGFRTNFVRNYNIAKNQKFEAKEKNQFQWLQLKNKIKTNQDILPFLFSLSAGFICMGWCICKKKDKMLK